MASEVSLSELEERGYTVISNFLPLTTTTALRETIDRLAPSILPADIPDVRRVYDLRHPLSEPIMAEIITPKLIALAQDTLRVPEVSRLRLLEQVLIRTDPKPPPYSSTGWHIDWAFYPREYYATPKQTYYHMVHACSTVEAGGGAFTIVPRSHHLTYKATAQCETDEELEEFKKNPAEWAGVNLSEGVEVLAQEGDLIIFNPMCLHSASANSRKQPRYVYFASFFDVSAERLLHNMKQTNYLKGFPDDLRNALPVEYRTLLDW